MGKIMKGIYLAAYKALHEDHDIVYQDINGKRDIAGDMMDVDLTPYDYIIATPPCNWWSRANYRRNQSEYALKTKHLLIDIIDKLVHQDKPFIIENVRNEKLFIEYKLYNFFVYVYKVGRHTYWSNIKMDLSHIVQKPKINIKMLAKTKRQGGEEVHEVVEYFINYIERMNKCEEDQ